MEFIDVKNELPPQGLVVEVKGDYTPEGTGYPKAYLRDYHNSGKLEWCSTEWRGTVAITHWRIGAATVQ